ncbi:MAG: DNA-deoxyinosine glycosylase [Clostridiales Family XIII bacterium]|jgi:hypoxanthine-DNA glycosylase|nr:DNA-deoxyinosine glycosylase [Clostridiales Family XIII bacterium]
MISEIIHPWEPVRDARSKILILGTIPSPKSRENGFYYGHPQNIFWQTLAGALGKPVPKPDPTSRTAFLLQNRIALWDVLHSCKIDGASDGSIRDPKPNIFRPLIAETQIVAVFTTGKKATWLFNRLCAEEAGMRAIYLPSTSPANRALQAKPSFAEQWSQIASCITRTERV